MLRLAVAVEVADADDGSGERGLAWRARRLHDVAVVVDGGEPRGVVAGDVLWRAGLVDGAGPGCVDCAGFLRPQAVAVVPALVATGERHLVRRDDTALVLLNAQI